MNQTARQSSAGSQHQAKGDPRRRPVKNQPNRTCAISLLWCGNFKSTPPECNDSDAPNSVLQSAQARATNQLGCVRSRVGVRAEEVEQAEPQAPAAIAFSSSGTIPKRLRAIEHADFDAPLARERERQRHRITHPAMAEHSMCQPGRPSPHGDGHLGSPGFALHHHARTWHTRLSARVAKVHHAEHNKTSGHECEQVTPSARSGHSQSARTG